MQISEIDQQIKDYDWYAADPQGYLVHFASAGGGLPPSVAASYEALAQVQAYFRALPIRSVLIHLNPTLEQLVPGVTDWRRYTESFADYAQRGLFAFDKTVVTRLDQHYHVVASPQQALLLQDLPRDIATVVSRTRLPDVVLGRTIIDGRRIP